jgi:hypothetical protein
MKHTKITPDFTTAELACIIKNPFRLPSMATMIEDKVGETMLKMERKHHVAKIPGSPKIGFGAAAICPDKWTEKALAVERALSGLMPQGRLALSKLLGCSRETAGAWAKEAITQGLVKKVRGPKYTEKCKVYAYTTADKPQISAQKEAS